MKRVLFIGQAMPRVKHDPHDWPTLNAWLFSIGLTIDQVRNNFKYSALVDYYPGAKNGSHLVPTEAEIATERARLHKTIQDFNPELIVPIGKLSISYCLNEQFDLLSGKIGNIFEVDPYSALSRKITVIPLPHPSGASTWRHKTENKKLLTSALQLLKKNLS